MEEVSSLASLKGAPYERSYSKWSRIVPTARKRDMNASLFAGIGMSFVGWRGETHTCIAVSDFACGIPQLHRSVA